MQDLQQPFWQQSLYFQGQAYFSPMAVKKGFSPRASKPTGVERVAVLKYAAFSALAFPAICFLLSCCNALYYSYISLDFSMYCAALLFCLQRSAVCCPKKQWNVGWRCSFEILDTWDLKILSLKHQVYAPLIFSLFSLQCKENGGLFGSCIFLNRYYS